MEEIREQIGYNVDPRDERFKAVLEQKEKEDKKRKKEEKKKKKAEKMLAFIQQCNVKAEGDENKQKSNKETMSQKNAGEVDEKENKKTE